MRLYHLADLHLGVDPPGLGRELYRRLVFEKLTEVIEEARREAVKFIIFAGDTFDSNALATSTVLSFLRFLAEVRDINFIFLPGGGGDFYGEVSGHDAYGPDSLYRRLEVRSFWERAGNLHLLTPEAPSLVFPEEKVAFYGGFFDYPRAALCEEAIYHVAVLHGAFGERAEFGEKPLSSPQLARYDYLALGHYHRFRKLGPKAAYAGAFLQFEFLPHQDATSGYVVVELKRPAPRLTYRELADAPRFLHLQVLDENDLERLKKLDFERTFVKITAYLAPLETPLLELKKQLPDRLFLAEGAHIEPENLTFYQILERIITDKVPEHYQAEVKELLLYGLKISPQRTKIEKFLQDKYGL